ncbi:hypothetical protein KQR57_09045 [Bacillus inaquosorum]|nr:hypothetical protein [Bacillus inaquosorum]
MTTGKIQAIILGGNGKVLGFLERRGIGHSMAKYSKNREDVILVRLSEPHA